jgi:hypothetical protein
MVWRYGIDSASGIGVKVSDRCGITERALQTLQSMQEMTEHTRHTQLIDDTPQRRHFCHCLWICTVQHEYTRRCLSLSRVSRTVNFLDTCHVVKLSRRIGWVDG